MKTKYFLPFLGFGLIGNQIAQAQVSDKDTTDTTKTKVSDKDTTKTKQTTRIFLLPFDSFYNAWSTGTTLTKYTLDINGPVNYDLRDKNGVKGSIAPVNFEKVKETFKKTNKHFKTDSARAQFDKELSKYPLLPKTLSHILDDGKILSKEEIDSLNALPDNDYILPFIYKSKNESVFGFARVIKRGKNFDYETLFGKKKDEARKDTSRTTKQDTLPTLPIAKDDKKEKLRIKLGLEAAIGTNKEKVLGMFTQIPLSSLLNLEGYFDYYIAKGNYIFSGEETEVKARERIRIGTGTYEQRTDEITTYTTEYARAEAGLGLALRVKDFEFPLRVGVNLSDQENKLYGKATIVRERNMEQSGDTKVITNNRDGGKKSVYNSALSAGVLYNINKNLSAGVSYNRVGRNNSARFNVRYKF